MDLAAHRRRLAEVRARAQRRAQTLQRDLDDIVASVQAANIDDEHDPEGATIAFERAQVTELLRSSRAELAAVEAALARAEAGIADRCESCGGPIGGGRLEARPTATRCVACATRDS